jgi:hypothetical protein
MSFFGFDPTGPKHHGHPSQGPGFGTAPDPFASISQNRGLGQDDDDEGYVCCAATPRTAKLTDTALILMTHMMDLVIN